MNNVHAHCTHMVIPMGGWYHYYSVKHNLMKELFLNFLMQCGSIFAVILSHLEFLKLQPAEKCQKQARKEYYKGIADNNTVICPKAKIGSNSK